MSTQADRSGWPLRELQISSANAEALRPHAHVSRSRTAVAALLLALAYYGGVHAGFALTSEQAPVALLWPPNSIVLAALLLSPPRVWPVLIAAVLPAHLLAQVSADVPLPMVLCWYVSNVTEALIGAWGIHRVLGRAPRFTLLRDYLVFLFWGCFIGPVLSTFLDASFVAAVGWRYDDYWTVWRTRLSSNVLAALIIVPLVVTWVQAGLKPFRRARLAQILEASALIAGVGLTSFLVFFEERSGVDSLITLYAPLPFLVWAAIRLGVSGVSLCVAILASFAVSGMLQGRGPFNGDEHVTALTLQIFLILASASLTLQSVSLAEVHNARQAALRQGGRLQLALAAARMGTWDWDVGSDRVVWSRSEEDSGVTMHERAGWKVTDVLDAIHHADRSRVMQVVTRTLRSGAPFELEFRWMGNGETRWISVKGKLDAHDGIQRILGVHMDTTERKTQDMQLQAQRDQLAHLSRVAMLGELSGALAHELNQPLTAIMTNAQAAHRKLQDDAVDVAEIDEILADIIAEDKRAGEVIGRLRALFLKGPLDMRQIDVNECVRDVLALEHSDFIARKVTVDTQLTPHLPCISGDRVQLQQVLLNLFLNACDAMRDNVPGDRHLRVTTRRAGDECLIEVCDCGIGIEHLGRIFEPFYTTKERGLGLGLPICQTIITTHRGRLWASNNAARGATLHVALPIAEQS